MTIHVDRPRERLLLYGRDRLSAAELMAFDAENGKGLLKRRATRIVECAPKKRRKKKQ